MLLLLLAAPSSKKWLRGKGPFEALRVCDSTSPVLLYHDPSEIGLLHNDPQ